MSRGRSSLAAQKSYPSPKGRERDNAAVPTRKVIAAAAAAVTGDGGRELVLGSLALALLAVASGSLLFLVTRTDVWESRP